MGISDTVLTGRDAITELIPQRPPIVMIDELVKSDDASTTTRLEVRGDNIFCEEGFLAEPGMIENIAQTAAARMGHFAKSTGTEVPIGFIAAVSSLSIKARPRVGETIETTVSVVNEVIGITIIEGTVSLNGEEIARCEMKIFIDGKK